DAVARVEPEVPPGLDGLFRHAEITAREGEWLVRAQDEFAGLAARQFIVVLVDDAGMETGPHAPHRARLAIPVAGDDEVGFRRAVALHEIEAEALAEGRVELCRHAGAERDPHRMYPVKRCFGTRQQDRHHSAEQIGRRGLSARRYGADPA